MTFWNKKQVAEFLGTTQRTITDWMYKPKDPFPVSEYGSTGAATKFHPKSVIKWYVRHEISKRLGSTDDGQVYDYEAERARLTNKQAEKAQLELQVLRGELIPATRVEEEQGAMVTAFRTRCLSIPIKAAPVLVNREDPAAIEGYLRELIYEALNELADFDPAQYGAEPNAESDPAGGTSEGSDSDAVGGRKSRPKPGGKRRAGKVEK